MANLQIDLAGVSFRNPVIIASCSLTAHLDKMKRLEDAGAGGLITKLISRFPLPKRGNLRAAFHGSGWAVGGSRRVLLEDGLELIQRAKQELSIPIIANFVGRSDDAEIWTQTAKDLEQAGADMLELDLNCHPEGDLVLDVPPNLALFDAFSIGQDPAVTGRVVKAVKEAVDIPIVSKLTPRAPDLVGVAQASKANGADLISAINALRGIPGLDISRGGRPIYLGVEKHGLSAICGPELNPIALKFTAILSKTVDLPLLSGGGVMTWEHVVERLMLGAAAVTICSAVYMKGLRAVTECVTGLEHYMEDYGYADCAEIRGCALPYFAGRGEGVMHALKARIVDEQRCRSCDEPCLDRLAPECLALSKQEDRVVLDREACTGCSLCYYVCPEGAIELERVE